jgi:dienelactone hydrolase
MRTIGILVAPALLLAQSQSTPPEDARKSLMSYLSGVGATQLAQRQEAMKSVTTRESAERHQAEVRKKILDIMGGLPERSAVRVREFDVIEESGFRVQTIAYESLPDFWVTANVYVPAGAGPFPAVILAPGHGPGKESQASWAANLARNGILSLAIDTFGAGERLQHYDPELETSKVEPSGEHEHAGLSTLLIGKHVSRYFVNDGIRGVDYLTQRKDVDAAHIGAFGCSGGGTVTAYLAALDPRISVAATACYISNYQEILNSTGAQDAEQTLPNFVANGLDFADWVELCAPRPYAIISTTNDMFPFAGARATFDEVKRFYGLYGAQDRLQFITGPGGHGNLGPISQPILEFLVRNLRGSAPTAEFKPFAPAHPERLTVTPSGQLATSIGGTTVEGINRQEARGVIVSGKPDVRAVAAIVAQPGEKPRATVTATEPKEGYHQQTIVLHAEPGMDIGGLLLLSDRPGRKPAVLMMQETPRERMAATPDVQRLVKSGHVVLLLQPRGIANDGPAFPPQQTNILGSNTALALQAMAVGKSLVGMRADDVIRGIDWLVSLPDVDPAAITVYGRGPEAMAALHAAVVDQRIGHLVLENLLVSYRAALDAPLHRNLSDVVLPGVLRHYDVKDLLQAIAPREIVLVNVSDAMGFTAREEALKTLPPVRTVRRGFRDPLPIE